MDVATLVSPEDQEKRENQLLEILVTEKEFLALICSKGLLHKDVQELYQKARSGYENIILNDHPAVELQEVEYSLWKLHYKHIDEFRKRLRQCTLKAESPKNENLQDDTSSQSIERHIEGFRSFLFEATEFYKNLIKKLRERCGLPRELFLSRDSSCFFIGDPVKMHSFQYVCHRFLICLGDLARYSELCKKADTCKWSESAIYYLEACRIFPDSGNPHNQLALLATYVGDGFLSLYHCVRSLAIKEPFPDAWNNLMLLFEKNRSSHLQSLSKEAHVDFSRPSKRVSLKAAPHANDGYAANLNMLQCSDHISTERSELWPLLVRLTSFFLARSSWDEFPCTLASVVGELEVFMELDGPQLIAAFECYQRLDSSRRGPHRALQLVTVLIFVIDCQTDSGEREKPEERDIKQQSSCTELVLSAAFICIGRLVERCSKCKHKDTFSLLPAILVFVEWLVIVMDRIEAHASDQKVRNAMSYFFGGFADILNQLDHSEELDLDETALWEDFELRGFVPLTPVHMSLDFRTEVETTGGYTYITENLKRSRRIYKAAHMLIDKFQDSQKWIVYDKIRRKYSVSSFESLEGVEVAISNLALEMQDPTKGNGETLIELKQASPKENQNQSMVDSQSVMTPTEEEEVIVFKPITRHNSAPLYTSIKVNDHFPAERINEQERSSSDELLRRSSSMFVDPNPAHFDSFTFQPDTSNLKFGKQFNQQEPLLKVSMGYPTGPPSLSAWVLDGGASSLGRENGFDDVKKQELTPIDEISSESLIGLSLIDDKDLSGSGHMSGTAKNIPAPPPYIAPVPSAPQLPDDAFWVGDNLSGLAKPIVVSSKEGDGILGASPLSGYLNRSATRGIYDFGSEIATFPPVLGMSSSEWLYHYRNNPNFEPANNYIWPVQLNAPRTIGNLNPSGVSRLDLFDQWGNHLASDPLVYLQSPQVQSSASLVYGIDDQRRDKPFLGNQGPSPYLCGIGTELKPEQPPLLQYLKQREWQLQRESQLRGPTFLGN